MYFVPQMFDYPHLKFVELGEWMSRATLTCSIANLILITITAVCTP